MSKPYRYYRRRRRKGGINPAGLLLIIGIVITARAYDQGLAATIDRVATYCLLLAVVVLVLVLLLGFLHSRRRRTLRTIASISDGRTRGLEFEKYVAELLKARGYSRVRLTDRFDLGIDIIAHKDGITWGVQVKWRDGMVGADAVRQVVTGLAYYGCTQAMVVTNATYSHPAQLLAQSNGCVLIDGIILSHWLVAN
jgi:restriction system protein